VLPRIGSAKNSSVEAIGPEVSDALAFDGCGGRGVDLAMVPEWACATDASSLRLEPKARASRPKRKIPGAGTGDFEISDMK